MRQANVRQHVKQVLWGRWGRGARGVGGRGNRPQPTRTECQSQSIESAKGHSSTTTSTTTSSSTGSWTYYY